MVRTFFTSCTRKGCGKKDFVHYVLTIYPLLTSQPERTGGAFAAWPDISKLGKSGSFVVANGGVNDVPDERDEEGNWDGNSVSEFETKRRTETKAVHSNTRTARVRYNTLAISWLKGLYIYIYI